jgi:hypothetical protein
MEILDNLDLPTMAEQHYFPPSAAGYSLMLCFRPSDRAEWFGHFASGTSGITQWETIPESDDVLVIADGNAYRVRGGQPDQWEEVASAVQWSSGPVDGVVVLATLWHAVAVDAHGTRWRVENLSEDGIANPSISGGNFCGEGQRHGDMSEPFRIDLLSGADA